MAEIDAEELERAIDWVEQRPPVLHVDRVCQARVLAAAEAHLASLRAPKGELEEARAELGAWLVANHDRRFWLIRPMVEGCDWCVWLTPGAGASQVPGSGPTEAAAIRAALSRARGEGA